MKKSHKIFLLTLITFLFLNQGIIFTQEKYDSWPQRVLLTNDDGIDNIGIIELARVFSKIAETYVVAPNQDRSGSTHFMSVFKKGVLKIEPRDMGEGIKAYAVDGFPADCVLLALNGIMRDNPPDLVISGINDKPNIAQDWLGSGTIGAARIAAFVGCPAIAVSGLDDDIPGAVAAATKWVVQSAKSHVVRNLGVNQYLTISIPRISPEEIKGIKITERAGMFRKPVFNKATDKSAELGYELWKLGIEKKEDVGPKENDALLYEAGYIVIVPMQANEHDYKLLTQLKANLRAFPAWSYPENDRKK